MFNIFLHVLRRYARSSEHKKIIKVFAEPVIRIRIREAIIRIRITPTGIRPIIRIATETGLFT